MKPARRRRPRTEALAVVAAGGTVAAVALEYAHVWRRGRATLPVDADGVDTVLAAGAEAVFETVEVAVEGYRSGTLRENALLNLLVSFSATFGLARLSTHMIRARGEGRAGPFRNFRYGTTHIHHFVPGILLAFLSGTASILSRDPRLDPWLAIPFGAGAALTLDESALLLQLDDVYWTEDGVLSVQITLTTIALLAAAAVTVRVLRRGERQVLGPVASVA